MNEWIKCCLMAANRPFRFPPTFADPLALLIGLMVNRFVQRLRAMGELTADDVAALEPPPLSRIYMVRVTI